MFNPFITSEHFARCYISYIHSPGFNSGIRGELLELLGAISAAARRQSAEAQKQLQEDSVSVPSLLVPLFAFLLEASQLWQRLNFLKPGSWPGWTRKEISLIVQ